MENNKRRNNEKRAVAAKRPYEILKRGYQSQANQAQQLSLSQALVESTS